MAHQPGENTGRGREEVHLVCGEYTQAVQYTDSEGISNETLSSPSNLTETEEEKSDKGCEPKSEIKVRNSAIKVKKFREQVEVRAIPRFSTRRNIKGIEFSLFYLIKAPIKMTSYIRIYIYIQSSLRYRYLIVLIIKGTTNDITNL